MDNDELLIAKAEDKVKQCGLRNIVTASGFLDPHEQSVILGALGRGDVFTRIIYYGGYDDAERVMMICLPDYVLMPKDSGGSTAEMDAAISEVMCIIRVSHPRSAKASGSGRELTHGDYLGALMGLGIERSAVGDIVVRDDGCDIIVPRDMADYIAKELTKAGKSDLETEIKELKDLLLPVKEFKEHTDTVASPRLDNIVSSAFGVSRAKAVTAIKSGLVFVDHMEALKPSVKVDEGSEIVFRHKGRAIISEYGGTSRKGRLYIKYLRDR